MIKKTTEWLVSKMVEGEVIKENQIAVQTYGLELVFSLIFTVAILLIVALLTNMPFEIIWAVIPFSLLRSVSGGWHASSHFRCITLFILMIVSELFLVSSVFGKFLMQESIITTLAGVACVAVFTFAPVESPTKPISLQNLKKYQWISRIVVIGLLGSSLLTYYFGFSLLGMLGVLSVTMQSLTLIPQTLSKDISITEE